MGKKEVDGTICKNRKAQITIFMIVGLLILFVFLSLITLSNSLKKGQLEQAQEDVYGKAFKKEAMRIYVEDCLSDELERGLILLGQQGRIWDDQPGGTRKFSNNVTGLYYSGDKNENRIAYGITRSDYLNNSNAYPCDNETNNPEFCQYKFPNVKLGFGELTINAVKNDLKRFLINRTIWCVANYTKANISNKAIIKGTKMDLKLEIINDGIDIKAEYPLKFTIGKEEFFHLSTFDFFYPTQFKWLLESAVTRPMLYDWKYLDFNYTEETLKSPFFTYGSKNENCVPNKDYYLCNGSLFFDKYGSLGIKMVQEEINGDDIYTFSSPKILNKPGFYQFRVARKNRPPALDYVERDACTEYGYDYLVIKDYQKEEQSFSGGETFSIKNSNTGGLPLMIISISSDNNDFKVIDFVPFILEPEEIKLTEVIFEPSKEGTQSAQLIVVSEIFIPEPSDGVGTITIYDPPEPITENIEVIGTGFLIEEDKEITESCLDFENDNLGAIEMNLCALDPDEDKINYYFEDASFDLGVVKQQPGIYVDPKDIGDTGFYEVTARATDEHGISDWQKIRVLVDRPMEINYSLWLPYIIYGKPYREVMAANPNTYTISNEDPIFINISYPGDSELEINPEIIMDYSSPVEKFSISLFDSDGDYNTLANQERCVNLPFDVGGICQLELFSDYIKLWPEHLQDETFMYPRFQEVTTQGELNISFSMDYCSGNEKSDSKQVKIRVAECIPHENPKHPWPWPKHENTYGLTPTNKTDLNNYTGETAINPFLATHACCDSTTWTLLNGTICYESEPELGCFGGSDQALGYGSGYLLEEQISKAYCDGKRGNICGGEEKKEWTSFNKCGDSSYSSCNKVAPSCENEKPFSLHINEQRWCHGTLGCEKVCRTFVVDDNDNGKTGDEGDACRTCNNELDIGKGCLYLPAAEVGTCGAVPQGASTSAVDYGCLVNGVLLDPDTIEISLCTPNELSCQGNQVIQCSSDGKSTKTIETCPEACSGGKCVESAEQLCVPDQKYCYDDLGKDAKKKINQQIEDIKEAVKDGETKYGDYPWWEDYKNLLSFTCSANGAYPEHTICPQPQSCKNKVCS